MNYTKRQRVRNKIKKKKRKKGKRGSKREEAVKSCFVQLYSCTGPTLSIPFFFLYLFIYLNFRSQPPYSTSPSFSLRLRERNTTVPPAVRREKEWDMVGLSAILETRKLGITDSTRQVINKSTLIMINSNANDHHGHRHRHHRSSSSKRFLDRCFLCGQKLLPGKDIYMYE